MFWVWRDDRDLTVLTIQVHQNLQASTELSDLGESLPSRGGQSKAPGQRRLLQGDYRNWKEPIAPCVGFQLAVTK